MECAFKGSLGVANILHGNHRGRAMAFHTVRFVQKLRQSMAPVNRSLLHHFVLHAG